MALCADGLMTPNVGGGEPAIVSVDKHMELRSLVGG